METDSRAVVSQEAGKPKQRLLLEPEEPLGEVDVTLHLHLHHSHPDQGAPHQAGQETDRILLVLDEILKSLKEEFLGSNNTIVLMLSGAVCNLIMYIV